ncbi:putative small nuclear ribonucleoprotein E [Helianthus annuus]|nr:putative small nuclear ribonucleoprotein E [Helianthus annuus]KAJ0701435.1 putative small nuclear ribonucleoprotein E [Helianthus annuus]
MKTFSVGFDEYMNLVLDEAEEVSIKKKTRKALGRILLKGDNITLMMNAYVTCFPAFLHIHTGKVTRSTCMRMIGAEKKICNLC